jgi:hypothetical protein
MVGGWRGGDVCGPGAGGRCHLGGQCSLSEVASGRGGGSCMLDGGEW